MNLSAHFTLEELTHTEVRDIDNTPSATQVDKLRWLAEQLELVRDLTGPMRVTSGYRCPMLNSRVGGQPSSQHMVCEAADLQSLGAVLTPLEMCRRVRDSDIAFDQLIYEFGAWMHISFRQDYETRPPRRIVLTIDRRGTREGLPH
jgi:putative chitinase